MTRDTRNTSHPSRHSSVSGVVFMGGCQKHVPQPTHTLIDFIEAIYGPNLLLEVISCNPT